MWQQISVPVLRKDFTVDSYMIDQAKVFGASAVLLICAILDDGELREYMAQAKALGLSVLVEAHDANEVKSRCFGDRCQQPGSQNL